MSACSTSRSTAGTFGLVHVAEARAGVRDRVVGVAEVVDHEPLGRRDVRDRQRLDRQDHDVLVERVEVLDDGAHRQRRGDLGAVEEHRGAGHPLHRRLELAELVDELAQRPLVALAPRA